MVTRRNNHKFRLRRFIALLLSSPARDCMRGKTGGRIGLSRV
jgi:hypothetical protein